MNAMLTKRALDGLFKQVTGGTFDVRFWDGAVARYGAGASPEFTLLLRDAAIFQPAGEDVLTRFAEGYAAGRIEVDGDVGEVIALAQRNQHLADQAFPTQVLGALGLAARLYRRSQARQKEDVAAHYDLGNDFFRLWLDESMTYSCAYFLSEADTLEDAQRQKINHSLRKLRLRPGDRLLDIGCGWGALVMHATADYDIRALGITLSEEQRAGACAAIRENELEERAQVRLAHYESLAREGIQFDRIVSIGMMEHVGKAHLREFAAAVATLLTPDGLALLHLITGPTGGPLNNWMERFIFPGSYIPSLPEILGILYEQGFRAWDVENLRPHYRKTLDHWAARFDRAAHVVRERYGETFARRWGLYLRGASASFREGALDVHQMLLSRGPAVPVPMTRADIYV
jgi:cyclopropane-fatty-acyl-phospholipid synthase